MQIVEEPVGLTRIRHVWPPLARLFVGALSLLPLYGTYDLLIRPRWNLSQMSWEGLPLFLFFLILGLIPLGLAFVLFSAAIFGPDQVYEFDRYKRRLTYRSSRRPGIKPQYFELDFSDLPPLEIEHRANSDGPDKYVVTLKLFIGKSAQDVATFTGKEAAEAFKNKLVGPAP